MSRKKIGCSSDNGHSDEPKFSAVGFAQDMIGIDNTLKQRVSVDGTYTDFVIDTGAAVSIVTKSTSRVLSLTLKKMSRANGSPLSAPKSEVLWKTS